MYIHLFANESMYSYSLLQCIKDDIDLNKHLFIFGFAFIKTKKTTYEYDNLLQSRIIRLENPMQMLKWYGLLKKSDWIYLHLLSYDPTLLFWRLNGKLLKKATWIIWGTDIYSYYKKNKNLKTRLYELMRKKIIPQFPEISAYVDQDMELIKNLYKTKAHFIKTMYPYPVNFKQLDQVKKEEDVTQYTNVMIGNSADSTNCHEEMITYLSQFKEEQIRIYCPLSYGGSEDYIKRVSAKGKEVFGDKFISITETMSSEMYSKFLSGIHIALMNHRRQQALGNITALLYLGRKVYLRNDVTTYHFMSDNGIRVFDIEKIKNSSFGEFVSPVSNPEENKVLIERISSDKYFLSLWLNLFERH